MSGRKGGKGSNLSGEDDALWGEVTRSVAPLRARPAAPLLPPAAASEPSTPVVRRAPTASRPSVPLPKAAPLSPALAPIDRRLKQRLGRGSAAIEARLDLHGMTQAAARTRLESFLKSAQAQDIGLVLVVTGKGKPGREPFSEERGVLRRQVPLWLSLPDLRPLVIGFDEAGPTHGGAGALYVRVRRRQRM